MREGKGQAKEGRFPRPGKPSSITSAYTPTNDIDDHVAAYVYRVAPKNKPLPNYQKKCVKSYYSLQMRLNFFVKLMK